MLPFVWADPNDPDEDPGMLFLFSAQNGLIEGMELAMSKDPKVLFMCDSIGRMSALHLAAASLEPKAVDAVRWLLKKGIPWYVEDVERLLPEEWARMHKNEESWTVLRNSATEFEYESYYSPNDKASSLMSFDADRNKNFCNSSVLYLNPHGAPEDEVALIVGPDATGVMMEWERPIMRETARLLLDGMPTTGLRVLNIGFGIGMIDTYFQDAQPAEHVIIEGHPTCLGWMQHKGWYDRPGVRILEGRWQEFFPSGSQTPVANGLTATPVDGLQTLLLSGPQQPNMVNIIGKFDIVYFDTFEESYPGHFAFIKNVPGLLRGPGSRFSYFNGHGVKGEISYQVYMEVARLHHNDLGMNTEYFPVDVDPKTKWYNLREPDKGVTRGGIQYTIPICTLAPTVPRHIVPNVGWKNDRQPEI